MALFRYRFLASQDVLEMLLTTEATLADFTDVTLAYTYGHDDHEGLPLSVGEWVINSFGDGYHISKKNR